MRKEVPRDLVSIFILWNEMKSEEKHSSDLGLEESFKLPSSLTL
jgi:hypothetical protein